MKTRLSSNFLLTFVAVSSVALGSFWYIAAAAPYAQRGSFVSIALTVGPTLFAVLILFTSTRSLVPLRLPAEADDLPLTRLLVVSTGCAYLALLPAFWALGRLLVATWEDPTHSEGGIFVALLVLWLPPWWAPFFGSVGAWHWIRRRIPVSR